MRSEGDKWGKCMHRLWIMDKKDVFVVGGLEVNGKGVLIDKMYLLAPNWK